LSLLQLAFLWFFILGNLHETREKQIMTAVAAMAAYGSAEVLEAAVRKAQMILMDLMGVAQMVAVETAMVTKGGQHEHE
jgi:hypothetical protein